MVSVFKVTIWLLELQPAHLHSSQEGKSRGQRGERLPSDPFKEHLRSPSSISTDPGLQLQLHLLFPSASPLRRHHTHSFPSTTTRDCAPVSFLTKAQRMVLIAHHSPDGETETPRKRAHPGSVTKLVTAG